MVSFIIVIINTITIIIIVLPLQPALVKNSLDRLIDEYKSINSNNIKSNKNLWINPESEENINFFYSDVTSLGLGLKNKSIIIIIIY